MHMDKVIYHTGNYEMPELNTDHTIFATRMGANTQANNGSEDGRDR